MTIRQSQWFSYGGQKSSDFGIINVNMDDGMLEEPFIASRDINEIDIRGRDKPYYQGQKQKNLVLQVSFAWLDQFDEDKIRQVKRWLCGGYEYYQPLFFSSNVNKLYYAFVVQDATLVHNAMEQGYVNLTFRTNSPVAYSPVYVTDEYECENTLTIEVNNHGDIVTYPEIFISKPLSTPTQNIVIKNTSNSKQIDLWDVREGEEIYINMENKFIETNYPLQRYDDMEGFFWGLEYGINHIQVTGKCKIRFRYQCKYL